MFRIAVQQLERRGLKLLLERSRVATTASFRQNHHKTQWSNQKPGSTWTTAVAAGLGLAVYGAWTYHKNGLHIAALSNPDSMAENVGCFIEGLPVYTLDEVSKHVEAKDGIWITYKNGVYDVTSFINQHPGGSKIMLGAGGSVEPFWSLYAIHKRPEVLLLMEQYRIGNLTKGEEKLATQDMEDPYANEPHRHPILHVHSKTPCNAEPPPSLLVESYITPTEIFYVRNHLPVPDVSVNEYTLEVVGPDGSKSLNFSLEELKSKYPKKTITATLQCAGNRRAEMNELKAVKGLQWTQGAIGNATWSGVRLRDVLLDAGYSDDDDNENLQIRFEGEDLDPTSMPYGSSIPLAKALNPRADVLLAYEMNGEPLTRDHGFPVRVIIPGTVGARWVKWLARIEVSHEESESHWQRNDYKSFSPSADVNKLDFTKAPAIQELPVTSVTCTPENNSIVTLKDGQLALKGYSWSGGGRRVIRVDVSIDQGQTWQVAELIDPQNIALDRQWAWTRWQARVPVDQEGSLDVWVRAVDSSYNVQPENFNHIWNARGLMASAFHKIQITVQK